jgi:hypothetical protein
LVAVVINRAMLLARPQGNNAVVVVCGSGWKSPARR